MKPLLVAGIALAVAGAFMLFAGGFSFGARQHVMRVGDMQVPTEAQRTVPPWVGGVAIVAGVFLVGAGVRKRGQA